MNYRVEGLVGSLVWLLACSSGGTTGVVGDASTGSRGDGAVGADSGALATIDASTPVDGSHPTDATGTSNAPPGAKRIFITQRTFQGNLAAGGGTVGADGACTNAAQAANLGGTWSAWVSTSTSNAIDRVSDVGPWYDLGGTMIFADKANLATSPAAALWRTETGTSLASDRIWTGTAYGGKFADPALGNTSCADWTSAAMADSAQIGQADRQDGAAWTAQTSTLCDQQAHLICLEQ